MVLRHTAHARPPLPARIATILGMATILILLPLAACSPGAAVPVGGASGSGAGASGSAADGQATVRLYTSVTQDTADAVVAGYEAKNPGVKVEVFRAPTGELSARIATERRQGGIRADVLWGTDPPSTQQYAAQGLFRAWTPREVAAVPPEYRTQAFWGTRVLNMVIVTRADLSPQPRSWQDLAKAEYRDAVALPDPNFAGSAFGALGYFAQTDGYGLDYYRRLKQNGAVQVRAIGDVVTGVAEGRYKAGMALDNTVDAAVRKGSPINLVWPEPGAIAMYSPIAVFATAPNPSGAESFVDYVLGQEAQAAIAKTGWQPIRSDVSWPSRGAQVMPDWSIVFAHQAELLEEYGNVFGG